MNVFTVEKVAGDQVRILALLKRVKLGSAGSHWWMRTITVRLILSRFGMVLLAL